MGADRRGRLGRLETDFDASVDREWKRFRGEPRRRLLGALRERFLQRHLRGSSGRVLELGPGPGRFSPFLRAPRGVASTIGVDISRAGLLSARRRARTDPRGGKARWIHAAGEALPFRESTFDTSVVFGNVIGMAGSESRVILDELFRVTRPGGRLLVEFASATGAVQEFLTNATRRRFLPKLLRDPDQYLIHTVLETGHQPYAPQRLARWEFQFFTPSTASEALDRAGFRVFDVMSVAPVAAFQPDLARSAKRDARTWENLIRLEERIGRRSGVTETGNGFLVAAHRISDGAQTGPRRAKRFRRPGSSARKPGGPSGSSG